MFFLSSIFLLALSTFFFVIIRLEFEIYNNEQPEDFTVSTDYVEFVYGGCLYASIILDVDFSKFQRGKGFWKFNNSLLLDPCFVELIKNTIKHTTCQYALINDDPDYIPNLSQVDFESFLATQTPESLQTLNLAINHELFFDTLLMEIRRATLKYSSQKKL